MVRNAADKIAANRAEEAQSSSDNISPVNEPLPPSPSSSSQEYYSDSDLEQQTIRSPNSAQRKIAHADKMSRITNALTQAAQIKPQLNGPDDWVEWNRKLNGTLAIANLWRVLIGERSPPAETDESFATWEDNQESLNGVLLLICGPSALSIIEKEKDASATQKYQLLKAEYDGQTLVTFSILYRKISRCNISNHKSLKEYGEEVTKARNKLVELGEPLPDMFVTCSFLDGLDSSYNAWKDMYFSSFSKNMKDEDGKMLQPTVEEILKLLIDRQTGQNNGTESSKSQPRAFKAGHGSKNYQSNNRPSSSQKSTEENKQSCKHCHSDKHTTDRCWYMNPKIAPEWFREKYPTDESRKEALRDVKNATSEWKKVHPKKGMKAFSDVAIKNNKDKDNTWYLDTAAAVHMTHDLSLYITPDLDHQTAEIETADGTILKTQGAGTIDLHVLVGNEHTQIELSNVHYLPELDANLISLGVLEEKGCEFRAINGFLQIKDKDDDIVMESIRDNGVYPLWQPKLPARTTPNHTIRRAYKVTKPTTKEKWHQRLGHVNHQDLAKMPEMATGISFVKNTSPTTEPEFCEACTLGKQHKVHSTEPPVDTTTEPGVRIHADLFGGGNTLPAVGGYRYGAILTDEATRMRFPMTIKSKDAICEESKIVFNKIETYTGKRMQYFRSDDAGEYQLLVPYFNEKGIIWEKSAPYAQDQDGIAERSIRTIIERARTMLIHAGLPSKLWPEALSAACYITNRLPTKALQGKTPFEAWYKRKPDISNLRVYGCDAYVVDYKAKAKGKMAPRSWAGTLVGYEAKNQWRIWDGTRIFVRRDIIFNESKFRYKNETSSEPVGEDATTDLVNLASILQPVGEGLCIGSIRDNNQIEQRNLNPPTPLNNYDSLEPPDNHNQPEPQDDESQLSDLSSQNEHPSRPLSPENQEIDSSENEDLENTPDPVHQPEENPLILHKPRHKIRHDYKQLNTRGFAKAAIFVQPHNIVTPKSYAEAMAGPQAKEWHAACKSEYESQVARGTFTITTLPYDYKAIEGKWVFKLKENPDGSIERYKARWVAKGYRQVQGRDYEETYAPVVRSDTSRILLAISAKLGWKIKQFDIDTAFLYGPMDRRLYTTQPQGFEQGEGLVCLLNMALYGLVQSAFLWFGDLKTTLKDFGLSQSKHDDALFYDTRRSLYITIYVDDIKAFCPDDATILTLKTHLQSKYKLKDIGDVTWYLGMEISRLKNGSLLLSQRKYIHDLLVRHGMENCAGAPTPMMHNLKLSKNSDEHVCDAKTQADYRTLLGELMYLMVQTRPDLAYSVSRLAQFMSNPREEHWTALKRVLRYLQSTRELGICYAKTTGELTLSAWTDSSWGEDPDDSRSTNGYVILMQGGPVAWKSQKQQSVALSSTEAEYVGQTMAATTVMWSRNLLHELQISGTVPKNATVIYADNQGAIKLAENPIFQKRSKHIAVKYHYTRDLIQSGEITLEYKKKQEMIADGLTKPLGPIAFKEFVKCLGLMTEAEAEHNSE